MDVIGLGLGVANAGINIASGMQQGKVSKAQRRRQKAIAQRKYNEDITEMGHKAGEINRVASEAINSQNESANDRGIYDSSIRTEANRDITDERDRRLAAMERQKGYMTADLNDQNYMAGLQDRMAKAQQWQQIANGIQNGVGGVDWSKF